MVVRDAVEKNVLIVKELWLEKEEEEVEEEVVVVQLLLAVVLLALLVPAPAPVVDLLLDERVWVEVGKEEVVVKANVEEKL